MATTSQKEIFDIVKANAFFPETEEAGKGNQGDFIMPINKKELTKAQIMKAMQCKTADEMMKLAKAEGFTITKDEAEAYMAELADVELDGEQLKQVAGGECYSKCPHYECDNWD